MSFNFEIEKAIQVVACLLKNEPTERLGIMKVLKLLYIADRESLRIAGFPITGDSPVAMEHGPVLSRIYDLMKEPEDWEENGDERRWREHFQREERDICLLKDPGEDELSEFELEQLDNVWQTFGSESASELRNRTHAFPEWRNNDPGKSSRPIPMRDILEAVGRGGEEASILEQRAADHGFARLFGAQHGVMLEAGDTFLNEDRPDLGTPTHLWFVLSDPALNAKRVLIVNISSCVGAYSEDLTCVLEPGDHPFVKHASFVYFAKAQCPSVDQLEAGFQKRLFRFHEKATPELLERIRRGALSSPFMARKYKDLLKEQHLV